MLNENRYHRREREIDKIEPEFTGERSKIALFWSRLACQSLAGSRESSSLPCNGQASLISRSADCQSLRL
jgi:hypothetical protein